MPDAGRPVVRDTSAAKLSVLADRLPTVKLPRALVADRQKRSSTSRAVALKAARANNDTTGQLMPDQHN